MADREVIQIGNRAYTVLFTEEDLRIPHHTEADYESIRDDIRERGVITPVVLDENNGIIDGATRLRICKEVGIDHEDIPFHIKRNLTDLEKRHAAKSANQNRRQNGTDTVWRQELTELRRQIVAQRVDRGESGRSIAADLGVSVSTVRNDARVMGVEFPETVMDADGIARPGRQTPRAPVPSPTEDIIQDTRTRVVSRIPEDLNPMPTIPIPEGEPRPIYDSQNLAVPARLRQVWLDLKLIRDVCAGIRALRQNYTLICASPAGAVIKQESRAVDRYLDNLSRDIYGNRPYAVCPTCEGQERPSCQVCKGRGWIIKAVSRQPGVGQNGAVP